MSHLETFFEIQCIKSVLFGPQIPTKSLPKVYHNNLVLDDSSLQEWNSAFDSIDPKPVTLLPESLLLQSLIQKIKETYPILKTQAKLLPSQIYQWRTGSLPTMDLNFLDDFVHAKVVVIVKQGNPSLGIISDNLHHIVCNGSSCIVYSGLHGFTYIQNELSNELLSSTRMIVLAFLIPLSVYFEYWNDKSFLQSQKTKKARLLKELHSRKLNHICKLISPREHVFHWCNDNVKSQLCNIFIDDPIIKDLRMIATNIKSTNPLKGKHFNCLEWIDEGFEFFNTSIVRELHDEFCQHMSQAHLIDYFKLDNIMYMEVLNGGFFEDMSEWVGSQHFPHGKYTSYFITLDDASSKFYINGRLSSLDRGSVWKVSSEDQIGISLNMGRMVSFVRFNYII